MQTFTKHHNPKAGILICSLIKVTLSQITPGLISVTEAGETPKKPLQSVRRCHNSGKITKGGDEFAQISGRGDQGENELMGSLRYKRAIYRHYRRGDGCWQWHGVGDHLGDRTDRVY